MSAPVGLADLGWDEGWARAFDATEAKDVVPGRVSLEHNHVFRVLTAEGERLAESAGRLKHEADGRLQLPVVGDWVAVRLDPAGGRSQIRHLLPRRTWFSRKVAGRTTIEQVVAANIDTVLVVFTVDDGVNLRGIERYLVVARRSGAAPVVVLNKADRADDLPAREADVRAIASGVPVVAISARTGAGMEGLDAYLGTGRTLALIGPSGVGKSTIVNRLIGHELLPTGEVREWDSRGRHTTVHRQLVVREAGGLIIDTPGMRELQLWDTEGVADAFDDVKDLAASCRFRNCQHDREPGCAVKAAVDLGAIDAARYQSYLKLQKEQTAIEEKRDIKAQDESKRYAKTISRALRAMQNDDEKQRR